MSDKLRIDWAGYLNDINTLIDKIRTSKVLATCVYGVEVGGLIPATVISKQLDLDFVSPHKMIGELNGGIGQVLIVDSVFGSGESLLQFQRYADQCSIVTLYKRKCPTLVYPDVSVHEVNEDWVVLPFERDVSASSTMPTSSRGG